MSARRATVAGAMGSGRRLGRRAAALGAGLAVAVTLSACAEQLDAGANCPALCPNGSVPILDTTLTPALSLDSTLVGYPNRGNEDGILLASRGDSVDVRAVIRFDTLLTRYTPPGDSSRLVTRMDSAYVRMRFNLTASVIPSQVTFELFDVDTLDGDRDDTRVLARFVPSRRLGAVTVSRERLTDSLRIPVDTAAVLRAMQGGARLRVGLRATGTGSVQLLLQSVETGLPAQLVVRVTSDTTGSRLVNEPQSLTPREVADAAQDLRDYALVVRAPDPRAAGTFAVGGLLGARTYLRFDIPNRFIDSVTIVRATLQLTQRPNRLLDQRDTLTLFGQAPVGSTVVTDLARAAQLILPAGLLVSDTLRLVASDSGARRFELVNLFRGWASQQGLPGAPVRALVLRTPAERSRTQALLFWGRNAPPGLRPTLRISYVRRSDVGIP